MVLEIPRIIGTIEKLGMIKDSFDNRNSGFGINLLPSEYISHVLLETDADTMVKELVTMHTLSMFC